MESPKQCIEIGASLVEAYGLEIATKQIEDNIKYLNISLCICRTQKVKIRNTIFNLAQQIDFWSQVLQTIKP